MTVSADPPDTTPLEQLVETPDSNAATVKMRVVVLPPEDDETAASAEGTHDHQ